MVSSPSPSDTQLVAAESSLSAVESSLSAVVYDLSQQVQVAMDNMLKMISEINQHGAGIMDDIEKCKESTLERRKKLEEEKDRFQKAAYSILDMLNNRG